MIYLSNKYWKVLTTDISLVREEDDLQSIKLLFKNHPLKAVFLVDEII